MAVREKFATQMNAKLLEDLRNLSKEEGRQLQVLVEEAIKNLLEDRRKNKARPHVIAAYNASHARYASLYEKLAK
jgi:hypothetical protein